jgi:hypothetical protein
MFGIGRPPVGIDGEIIEAASLCAAFDAIMTKLAQRLQRTQAEVVPAATMWLDMVGDRRQREGPMLQAKGAQGFDLELVPTAATPDFELVPLPPRSRLGERRAKSAFACLGAHSGACKP